VRLEQLMRFFDPKLARKLDDTNEVSYIWSGSGMGMASLSQGFFSIYRSLFALLASDERLHTPPDETPLPYPGFGDSTTSYAAPRFANMGSRLLRCLGRLFNIQAV
jgi:DnaJ family protein A protein 5